MKIEGPGRTSGAKGASKTGSKKSADGSFGALISDTEEAASASSVSRTSAVGALDALLTLQGAEEGMSEEAKKRAKKRGAELLDHLDKIRLGLLSGGIPASSLQQLSHAIAANREQVTDPKLSEILDEIDLRAQVELAKLGR